MFRLRVRGVRGHGAVMTINTLILAAIAGGIIGAITPRFIGPEWYKFALGQLAIFIAYAAGRFV